MCKLEAKQHFCNNLFNIPQIVRRQKKKQETNNVFLSLWYITSLLENSAEIWSVFERRYCQQTSAPKWPGCNYNGRKASFETVCRCRSISVHLLLGVYPLDSSKKIFLWPSVLIGHTLNHCQLSVWAAQFGLQPKILIPDDCLFFSSTSNLSLREKAATIFAKAKVSVKISKKKALLHSPYFSV